MSQNTLIVLVGPTGVGKTQTSLQIAKKFGCDIISSDSRQVFKQMSIGTAAATAEEQKQVPHHFVQFLNPDETYNASQFESDVLKKLDELFAKNPVQLMVGGSMMYVDAICKGIDIIPDVDPEVRERLKKQHAEEGLEGIRLQLKTLDPLSYEKVDLKNPARLIHAVEVCLTTGKPYSSFLKRSEKKRDFRIVKIGLNMGRDKLYDRINQRVELMIAEGLETEVKALQNYREFQALQTVGYREMFDYLDGNYDLKRAIQLIQRNSRHYAKKQLTWFRKDADIHWFHPDESNKILHFLAEEIL